ncbi:cobalamin-binding protein [Gilvimarinus sp. DA14]|uniref:cobalamin-binding protein n=1 Tax=Gilvimarinus sp. DA14 TaxID=2956798 RepID=UPI0020B80F12|nr:cobalamin-binding protein [Gilvimarinus sp. DA14]UTF60103.1 cobalamin-binding protein [Gilvimarinus sp. DA14]
MRFALLITAMFAVFSVHAKVIEVVDARGKTLRLQQPAERIVALAPHIVENVYSAGAGPKLVAAVSYSDYPAEAQALPQVGSYKAVNYEAILALKPDLVLGWASGNGPEVARQLERLGLTVYVDELRTMDDIAAEVRTIGQLAGTSSVAEPKVSQWQQRLEQLKQAYHGAEAVTVFYQVWNDPLQTLNGEHLVSDVIRLCGGENIFADAISLAPKINIESVLARDPDTIIASGMGEQRPEWLEEWKQYTALSAVKNQHLYFVPPDIIQRHTLRILDGADTMCRQLDKVRAKSK